MKAKVLTAAVLLLYVLHQDFWNWKTPYPVVFGFLPIGLFYHVCYSIAAAVLMTLFVRLAWPEHLEKEAESGPRSGSLSENWRGPRCQRRGAGC
jgi:hypothetical protein